MLNSSIGPLIFKKKTQGNAPQKKPMTPGPMNMYSLQIASQNKMPNPNMSMPQNAMGGMKPQDPTLAMQQMQASTLKIENVSMQGGKKVGPHFMVKPGMISSPNMNQAPNPTKEMDPRQQMNPNPMGNMPLQPPMTGMNSLAQPVAATNISLALKGNDKELGKTSEIPTNTLKIGSNKFSKDCKIVTKIVFTKKQFIWEIAEIGSPKKGEEEGKSNKRKFELKFSDIDKIDVSTDGNSIRIEAKEKPAGFKELYTTMKKTAQWIKEPNDGEHEFGEEVGLCIIDASYPKESLTKVSQGKISHLDKLKRCELPLFIDGKSYIDSVPSTPLKTSSVNFGMAGDSYGNLPNTPQLHQSHSNLSQMLPFTAQKKELPYGEFAFGGQKPLSLVHQDSNFSVDLHAFNKDTGGEKILEESPQGEGEEDDEDKEFPPLTKDKKADAKKFEGQLKNMKLDDKIDIIMETIKPKRFGINVLSKKIYKCPLYKCGFSKASVSHLKSHFQQKHRRIVEKGFSIDETGSFHWKPELLDFSLMVSKIYPKFVRNIIREAKKMP